MFKLVNKKTIQTIRLEGIMFIGMSGHPFIVGGAIVMIIIVIAFIRSRKK